LLIIVIAYSLDKPSDSSILAVFLSREQKNSEPLVFCLTPLLAEIGTNLFYAHLYHLSNLFLSPDAIVLVMVGEQVNKKLLIRLYFLHAAP
jgi:hypothetical protein